MTDININPFTGEPIDFEEPVSKQEIDNLIISELSSKLGLEAERFSHSDLWQDLDRVENQYKREHNGFQFSHDLEFEIIAGASNDITKVAQHKLRYFEGKPLLDVIDSKRINGITGFDIRELAHNPNFCAEWISGIEGTEHEGLDYHAIAHFFAAQNLSKLFNNQTFFNTLMNVPSQAIPNYSQLLQQNQRNSRNSLSQNIRNKIGKNILSGGYKSSSRKNSVNNKTLIIGKPGYGKTFNKLAMKNLNKTKNYEELINPKEDTKAFNPQEHMLDLMYKYELFTLPIAGVILREWSVSARPNRSNTVIFGHLTGYYSIDILLKWIREQQPELQDLPNDWIIEMLASSKQKNSGVEK